MIWQLAITPGAERDFKQLPKPDQQWIKDDLYALVSEMFGRSLLAWRV